MEEEEITNQVVNEKKEKKSRFFCVGELNNDIKSHYIYAWRGTSHHTASHHITSHHITSHHITKNHITSQHNESHHITSQHATLQLYT